MATAIELPANIARSGKFSRWVEAVDLATRDVSAGSYTGLLKAAAGEISLSSKFGQWCWHLSAVIENYFADVPSPDAPNGSLLLAKLRAAGGEVPLTSAFGLWSQRVSLKFGGGGAPPG